MGRVFIQFTVIKKNIRTYIYGGGGVMVEFLYSLQFKENIYILGRF